MSNNVLVVLEEQAIRLWTHWRKVVCEIRKNSIPVSDNTTLTYYGESVAELKLYFQINVDVVLYLLGARS